MAVPMGTNHLAASCPGCSAGMEAYFFPALYRPRESGAAATTIVDHTESSCYYHPQKRAVQVCDACGRFVCALCSIDLGSEHLCPTCLSAGKRKGKITSLENVRTCYDRIATSLAVLGLVFWPVSLFLAPASIYISIRHWNSPGSLLGVSRRRFIIAITLASLELLGWLVFLLAYIFVHPKK
jgi:hypothetical protein